MRFDTTNLVRNSALGLALTIAILLGHVERVCAQTGPRDGSTPLALAPGAPAGSYPLSGFETVNPYNGALTFSLPLLQIGGRGGAAAAMVFSVQPKNWSVRRVAVSELVDPNGWEAIKPGYGPGVLQGRSSGEEGNFFCAPTGRQSYVRTLTRLTFTSSDGTEYEFRDRTLNGQPAIPAVCNQGTARGRVFQTTDGTAATFISDTAIVDAFEKPAPQQPPVRVILPSGFLLFRDGSRYRIDNGLVTWIRDRNGNLVRFFYDGNKRVTSTIDSLNRTVSVTYADMTTTLFDEITYKGFQGQSHSIKIFYADLQDILRSDYPGPAKTYFQLFALNSSQTTPYNPKKPQRVRLPDGRVYRFNYNYYGELARVELPTGGAIEYDAVPGTGVVGDPDNEGSQIYRRVEKRRVYPDGGSGAAYEMLSTYSTTTNPAVVDHYGPGQVLQEREKHYYTGDPIASLYQGSVSYPGWQDGKEYRAEVIDTNGTQVLQRVDQVFQQRESVPWWTGSADREPANDPRLVETTTTLPDTNQVARRSSINPNDGSVGFDRYNNPTDVWEYDFGVGAAVVLIRRTHTDYVETANGVNYQTLNPNNSNPDLATTIHVRNLPLQESVYDPAGVETARTTYEYDIYAAGLTSRLNITGHDTTVGSQPSPIHDTGYITRGNVTARVNWELSSGQQLTTRMQYDIAGHVVSVTDPKNNLPTTFEFADRFGVPDGEARNNVQAPIELGGQTTYGFITQITNPFGHTAYTQFDYYVGQPINGEDSNQVVSKALYNDPLERGTELVLAVGTSAQRRTTFSYDDAARLIANRSDQETYNDGLLKTEVLYDGLGRTTDTRRYEDGPPFSQYILTKQNYDAMGRTHQVSNPYRPNASPAEALLWTTTNYDGLGRVVNVTTPDTAIATTSYSGSATTTTDQAGKLRRTITDGLGRLIRVDEPTTTGLGSVATPNQPMSYTYDALGNLRQVVQGGQTRTFSYDSLSRLTQAINPENGTIAYTYDKNSNVETKRDTRGVVTTFTYDALDRLATRTYSGPAPGGVTPGVTYAYDSATPPVSNSRGRLVSVSSAVSSYSYTEYDPVGNVLTCSQTILGHAYLMSYQYNLAGSVTRETYPSNKVVVTEYDNAGRIAGIKKDTTNYYAGAASGSANAIAYASHGAISSMKLGNGLWEHTSFNSRLQPTQIGLGSTSTGTSSTSVLGLNYTYGVMVGAVLDTTKNNGNIESQTINPGGLIFKQSYTYDELNRLSTATETSSGGQPWQQAYDYDRYGNRAVRSGSQYYIPSPQLTPQSASAGDLSAYNSNNRIVLAGFGYDDAGNLTRDPSTGVNAIVYDGDNKQISYTKNGITTQYFYDGDGRRVKKVDVGTNRTTVFVYNVAGQLVAEYQTDPVPLPPGAGGTSYLTTDDLGSTRVVTTSGPSPTVKARYDYLPFGEQIDSTIGNRSSVAGYVPSDATRQKFTHKERDLESGLDNFLARYYSSAQGRFTSPDEFAGGPDELYYFAATASENPTFYADLFIPQSLNKYQYCYNNPLRYVDEDGHQLDRDRNGNPTRPVPPFTAPPDVAKFMAEKTHEALMAIGDAEIAAAEAIGRGAKRAWDWVTGKKPDVAVPPLAPPPVDAQTEPQTQPQAPAQPTTPPQAQAQPLAPPKPIAASHTKRRGSKKRTNDKHNKRDPGDPEKGDVSRRAPRRPPGGKTPKGGWPPKPKPVPPPTPPPTPPKQPPSGS